MFVIKYTAGPYTGTWSDTSIRGNTEPMTYTEESYASQECNELNMQYNNEGYCFFYEAVV